MLKNTVIAVASAATLSASAGMSNGYTGQPAPQVLVVNYSQTNQANPAVVVLTNNVTVQAISLVTSAGVPAVVNFYDSWNTNAPYFGTNYVNTNSFVSTGGYATNYVSYSYQTNYSSYGVLLNYTNYYTNTGWWTYFITNNPTTNALAPQAALVAVSGSVASYNNPVSFQQGVAILASTNVTAIIYYTPNK